MNDELTIDTQTGELVPVGAEATGAATADEELELSIFADGRDFQGSGVPSYSLSVKIGGTTFFGKELGAGQLEHVAAENRAIAADSKAIRAKKQSEQQAAGEAVARRSLALAEWVIGESVAGWKNPKWPVPIPYNEENRRAMSNSAKTRLSDDIIAKSYSGRAASDVAESF